MTADVNEKLGQFLREGQDWEKKPTNIPGASLLKLPTFKKSPPSIAIEINPINATKKKGIIIRSGSELEQINQLLSNPKVVELAKKIEIVNPKTKEDDSTTRRRRRRRRSSNTEVFEI
ncbi:MAG: hypothetical protein ACJ72X_06705 [Nitrososphaeraceae archaeon]